MAQLGRINDADLERKVGELARNAGEQAAAALVSSFVSGGPAQIEELERRLPGPPESTAACARAFRNECVTVGAWRLAWLCEEAEAAVIEGDRDSADRIVAVLGREFDRVGLALRAYYRARAVR